MDANKTECYFLQLPRELIEHILKIEFLHIADICHVAQTCITLKDIAYENEIWKHRIRRRWYHLLARYSRDQSYNWYIEYKNRHLFGLKIRRMVEALSPKYYTSEEISKEGFREFRSLLSQHKHAGEFLVDELMEIVHHKDVGQNLTVKYYAEKVLRFLQHEYLTQKIKDFLQLDPSKQKLETGAVMVAQWCQPMENITENGIADQLDSLAADVRKLLKERDPTHPIFSREFNYNDITEDMWSTGQCRSVLDCLNTVLFEQHEFHGNKDDYYNQTNSYIDKVLQCKTGIPISLSVIYSAVAKRLGLVCEPVNFPAHFLLSWKEHPMFGPELMYTYIDVFNGGKFMSFPDLPRELSTPANIIDRESLKVTSPSQVFERMVRNLVGIGRQQGRMGDSLLCLRNALELFLIICPNDIDMRLLQVRVNLHLNINLPDVMDSLQRIADSDQARMGLVAYLMQTTQVQMTQNQENKENKEIKPKYRRDNADVEYAVGMIMLHKRYRYKCVIYGWDSICQATEEWIVQMGVHNLARKQHQPFYNVLVEDGTNRYAAQENLTPVDDPSIVTHPEIGRYFQEFCGTYYFLNHEKFAEYPDDLAVTKRKIQEIYNQ
ncbi:hypothetical protein ACJMK2_011098 [Sinanodonta woodiana]|uniref:Hemimethylated DNA-binding domain-containing protein n=1 Tax=Sinanodonta woodiana TaxID=1069815 RepID=A0ABD3V3U4_SINWO